MQSRRGNIWPVNAIQLVMQTNASQGCDPQILKAFQLCNAYLPAKKQGSDAQNSALKDLRETTFSGSL